MGYAAQTFAINIQQVKDVFGSNDEILFKQVKQSSMYEVYAEQDEDGLFEQCLKDIIFNYVKPANRKVSRTFFGLFNSSSGSGLTYKGHLYGYNLIAICDVLGTFLTEEEGDIFYTGDDFDEANHWLKNKGFTITMERFWNTEDIFDIPKIDDFPVISSFNKTEIAYLHHELTKLNLADTDFEQKELLIYFRDKLKVCIDKNTEWLSFTH